MFGLFPVFSPILLLLHPFFVDFAENSDFSLDIDRVGSVHCISAKPEKALIPIYTGIGAGGR